MKQLFYVLAFLLCTFSVGAQETLKNVNFDADFFSGENDRLGIIIVAGSGMYKDNQTAKKLNKMGYNVLSLAYYDSEGRKGLPKTLEMIPLEYFEAPKKWLLNRSSDVVIFGLSKGAELSLLLASKDDDYKAVIALAPSKVVWQGFPKDFSKIMESPSSWSSKGKAIPFVPYISREMQKELGIDNRHQASMTNRDAVNNALIHVENIKVPTLLLSGGKDQSWPSTQMAWDICKRMTDRFCSHVNYPDGDHLLENFKENYLEEVKSFLKKLP